MHQIASQRIFISKNFGRGHAPRPPQEARDLWPLGASPPNDKTQIEPCPWALVRGIKFPAFLPTNYQFLQHLTIFISTVWSGLLLQHKRFSQSTIERMNPNFGHLGVQKWSLSEWIVLERCEVVDKNALYSTPFCKEWPAGQDAVSLVVAV